VGPDADIVDAGLRGCRIILQVLGVDSPNWWLLAAVSIGVIGLGTVLLLFHRCCWSGSS
jgi:hypothetical protein